MLYRFAVLLVTSLLLLNGVMSEYRLPGLLSFDALLDSNPEIQQLELANNLSAAEAGFCLANSMSSYSTLYFPTVPDVFQNCNRPGDLNFNDFNMTLQARINVMDLSQNGFNQLQSSLSPQCLSHFPDFCYLVMWQYNIKMGFRCINTGKIGGLQDVNPTCKSSCSWFIDNCPSYRTAIQQRGESGWMICELYSNNNKECINNAP